MKLRKDPTYIDTFIFGDYEQVLREHPSVYAYLRSYEDDILVVTNFFDDVQTVTIEGLEVEALLLSNYKNTVPTLNHLVLRPYESFVLKVKKTI